MPSQQNQPTNAPPPFAPIRTRGLYDPAANAPGPGNKPFTLSRSKLEDFVRCPRCFYLDRRLGLRRPSIPAFTLNSAVDTLLKKEFDIHRTAGTVHPLFAKYGVGAIPFTHAELDEWRKTPSGGAAYLHEPTGFLVKGIIDDIWLLRVDGRLIIADYKATSTTKEITLNDHWKASYKRQMEVYQWIFRRLGHDVSPTGYFVYCNGRTDLDRFDAKLEFNIELIPYEADDSWVEPALIKAQRAIASAKAPKPAEACEYCAYSDARQGLEAMTTSPS